MKKIIFFASTIIFFGLAPDVFAQGFVPLAPIPGLTQGATADTVGLANFFNNLYKYLIGVAAILAVIEIIWGGLEISTQDSVSKKSDGKQRIYNAIGGLVLVLSPVLVFSIINPSILNLSLKLPELDTAPGIFGGGGGNQNNIVDQTSGCSVSGTVGVLQIATCPSASAATAWGQNCSGNLSTGPQMSRADGTVTSVMMLCAGKKNYVFIQIKNFTSFSINTLKPLAVASDNPNNANDAINFANTCQNMASGKTCISDIPLLTFATECLPSPKTSLPKGDIVGCFNETLSCVPSTGFGELLLNPKCASSPSWTPFQ